MLLSDGVILHVVDDRIDTIYVNLAGRTVDDAILDAKVLLGTDQGATQ